MTEDETPPSLRPRWGVRSLLWLTLSFVCVIASNGLQAAGNSDWVVMTFAGTICGLGGAAYCSVRGLASSGWLGR